MSSAIYQAHCIRSLKHTWVSLSMVDIVNPNIRVCLVCPFVTWPAIAFHKHYEYFTRATRTTSTTFSINGTKLPNLSVSLSPTAFPSISICACIRLIRNKMRKDRSLSPNNFCPVLHNECRGFLRINKLRTWSRVSRAIRMPKKGHNNKTQMPRMPTSLATRKAIDAGGKCLKKRPIKKKGKSIEYEAKAAAKKEKKCKREGATASSCRWWITAALKRSKRFLVVAAREGGDPPKFGWTLRGPACAVFKLQLNGVHRPPIETEIKKKREKSAACRAIWGSWSDKTAATKCTRKPRTTSRENSRLECMASLEI